MVVGSEVKCRLAKGAEMDGYTFRDFLPAIAILGPIIAATLTLFVTRRWQTRKQVTFFSGRTEDLIEQLREHRGELLTITSGGHELDAFNRAEVTIKNTGNTAIQNFSFEIVIPGEHQFISGKVTCSPTCPRL
jgi:hypothetical protein